MPVNIAAATSIVGKTKVFQMNTTSLDEALENAASSNTVIKINSVVITNLANADADVSGTISDASGGSDVIIAHLITVPAKTNLVLISADMRIYLEENKAINLQASVANRLGYCISYEVIS